MKAHLVQSAEPLKEGEDRQVLCGRTVIKSQSPFIWDEMSMGQLNLSSDLLERVDSGIKNAVLVLRSNGVETFESCEGGPGHAYPEPTVRFHGSRAEGMRALAAAMQAGLKVAELRRVWPVLDDEPTGPWWELTFIPTPE